MRAQELIRTLGLAPHPEGGYYREVHRSPAPPGARPASTAIYFLLVAGQVSRWHRVDAEETWHHYEGAPLELLWEAGGQVVRAVLGPDRHLAVVPAHAWQAARPLGDYALMGCTVAPGFDFRGFSLLDPESAARFKAWPDLL
jgi:predicted cupin superfamily sugar epimerase